MGSRVVVVGALVCATLAAACTSSAPAGSSARPTCAPPSRPPVASRSLESVGFVSPLRGWALASNRILATSDGGRTWQTQYRLPRAHFTFLDVLDATRAWAVGAHTVVRTADGQRWNRMPDPCPSLASVDFRTATDGFAVTGGLTRLQRDRGTHGTLLSTHDGGRHWAAVAAPGNVQSVCFDTGQRGWLGARGRVFYSSDGGRDWNFVPHTLFNDVRFPGITTIQCAGADTAWAEWDSGGAAASQSPHVALHLRRDRARSIFAEQYFRLTGGAHRESPGGYPGPFAPIDAHAAVYLDACVACTSTIGRRGTRRTVVDTVPVAVAESDGWVLARRGIVTRLSVALGASFVSIDDGWVVGRRTIESSSGQGTETFVVEHTADGGRTWRTQYSLP